MSQESFVWIHKNTRWCFILVRISLFMTLSMQHTN